YNALDVMVTYESAMKMMNELRSCGLWDTYVENYLGCFEPALRMEWYGTPIDTVRRAEARVTLVNEVNEMQRELQDIIKMRVITKVEKKGDKPQAYTLNLASSKQMQAFFTARGYKIPVHRKTGRPSLDKDALGKLAVKHNDSAIKLMLRMKQVQDLINDVIDQPLDANNNIHCH